MRAFSRFTAIGLMIIVSWIAADAAAQDIFVKPANSPTHPVDLGVGIKQLPPDPKPPVAPPAPPAQVPVQQTSQPSQPTLPQKSEPQPEVQKPAEPAQLSLPQPTSQPGTEPLQIIPVNEEPVVIPPGTGPNVFSAHIAPSALGQAEVNDIYKSLGLNAQEIAKNCVYENMVILSIGDNGSAISMGQMTAAQQRFSGDIKTVDVFPTIACKKIKHPISGYVIEQGPYYKISATNITCPPPPHGGSLSMAFKYLGNGHASCELR